MPELPEVQTTVNGINKLVTGLKIVETWTDYNSSFHAGKDNIKNPSYFKKFKKLVEGATISNSSRRGKNVLIHLSNDHTILIHMKMTGHLMYGKYEFNGTTWTPVEKNGPLRDPFNKFIHLVFLLSNNHHLVFSDMRKFAKVFVTPTQELEHTQDFKNLGLEPLSSDFTYSHFKEQLLKKPQGKIKQVLMDQSLVAGIGNIYSDEILWDTGLHPESTTNKIPESLFKKMFVSTLDTLSKGIDFGGDSTSDYRNIYGERGSFQHKHNAYRRTGEKCPKKSCTGIILRKVIGGRSGHFCDAHQIKF
ncbi:MAG: bifunctional DNA-formamidopyrimidine glycosylase/DNA-(apurinic or apyrimidinic site) lyase [bacterium]|nr:bifunctional DNA-formamidopyrimidine glycosylase/DNA-(apurinic or apyrimidinic site) lyase [bacterium]